MSDPTPTASPTPGGGEAEQKALVPLAPKGLDSAAESALVERAEQLAGKVQAQPGDRQLSRQLGALGAREQQSAAQEINLLKTRVGTLLKEVDGEGGEIPKALVELRHQMDEIKPSRFEPARQARQAAGPRPRHRQGPEEHRRQV